MADVSTYSTGTVSIGANATSVVGSGSNWTGQNAMSGDTLSVMGFGQIKINSVTDATHLVIDAWPFGAVSAGTAYSIKKDSSLRFVGAQTAVAVDKMVTALNTNGLYVFVGPDDTAPDPSLGDDEQYAFQATTGKQWQKVDGAWNFIGTFKALGVAAAWNSATAYVPQDVVSLDGTSYVCIRANTNETPPNATYWTVLAAKGDKGDKGDTGDGYAATSGTSLTIGTGSKTFITQAGLAYVVGSRIRLASAANVANYMEGQITAYAGTSVTANISKASGSGTFVDWNISIAGDPGSGDMLSTANLADVSDKTAARLNLGVALTTLAATGPSATYDATVDRKIVLRSNGGAAMGDTLPGTSPGVMPAGWLCVIENTDTGGILAINVGAGAALVGAQSNGYVYVGPGQSVTIQSDGGNYRVIAAPHLCRFGANTTIFIATTGSAANDGLTSSTPVDNLQTAWNLLSNNFDTNGFNVTLKLADGTYPVAKYVLSGWITGQTAGNGQRLSASDSSSVNIVGNITTPANVFLQGNADLGIINVMSGARVSIQGVKMQQSALGYCVYVWQAFASTQYIDCAQGGENHLTTQTGGYLEIYSPYTVSGGANSHCLAGQGGNIQFLGHNLAQDTILIAAPLLNFPSGYAASQSGYVQVSVADFYGGPGGAVGTTNAPHYACILNGVIDTGGLGVDYFPGNSPGSDHTNTGGIYH
jgi:hypothetical protein